MTANAPGRTPLIIEALGYVGGALSIVAGLIVADRVWPGVPVGVRALLTGLAMALLLLAGAVLHIGGDPAFRRLRSVLWAMSAAAAGALTYILAAQAGSVDPQGATTLAAAVAAGYGAELWRRCPSAVLHVAVFAGAAVTVGCGIARVDGSDRSWAYGLGVWLLSVAWAAGTWFGVFHPRTAGYVAAAAGTLFGALLTTETDAGRMLADLTAVALIAGGVLTRRAWLLGFGVAGLLLFIPQTVTHYLPQSVAGPAALLAVGLALVAVALWLARRRQGRP